MRHGAEPAAVQPVEVGEVVAGILERNAEVLDLIACCAFDVNAPALLGMTLLGLATYTLWPQAVKALLDAGADPREGRAMLDLALLDSDSDSDNDTATRRKAAAVLRCLTAAEIKRLLPRLAQSELRAVR